MAGRTKSKAQNAGLAGEQDDARPRQPAWRQPPANPRKRTRRNSFAVQRQGNRDSARDRAPLRAFAPPSRETILSWLRIGGLLTVAVVVGAGLIYLLQWPVLQVWHGSTLIGGAQRIESAVIYDKAEVGGRNILLLHSGEVAARLEAVPGIADATVHLRLPNEVIIDVVEHAPLVAWQTITSTMWLSASGAEVPQSGGLPPLQLVDQSGGRLTSNPALKTMILDNLKTIHEARPEQNELYYGNTQGLYYRAAEGWEVWLGENGDVRKKLALALAAGQDLARTGARPAMIDLRHSDKKAMLQ